ncbi:MAG: hypothetical protein LBQ94_09185 [Treponema sp.]|nr:hypothetical protein [Treponema sp.]
MKDSFAEKKEAPEQKTVLSGSQEPARFSGLKLTDAVSEDRQSERIDCLN